MLFLIIPWRWPMPIDNPYLEPLVGHSVGRACALAAYERRGF